MELLEELRSILHQDEDRATKAARIAQAIRAADPFDGLASTTWICSAGRYPTSLERTERASIPNVRDFRGVDLKGHRSKEDGQRGGCCERQELPHRLG